MVKHIILWTIKEEYSTEEKQKIIKGIKNGLESLEGKIPGLNYIKVNCSPLSSSNTEVMLDSCFESEEALKGYSVHPEHVSVADTYVRPYTKTRSCFDYEA